MARHRPAPDGSRRYGSNVATVVAVAALALSLPVARGVVLKTASAASAREASAANVSNRRSFGEVEEAALAVDRESWLKPKTRTKFSDKYLTGDDDDDGKKNKGFFGHINPFSKEHKQMEKMTCGETMKVNSKSYSSDRCPEECPFFAQDKTDRDFCTFTCVRADECVSKNPDAQIGDKRRGICRSCMIDFCRECDITSPVDRCAVCHNWYYLGADGICHFEYETLGYSILAVIGVIFLLVMLWVVDMAWRPISNATELRHAEASRYREKIHTDPDAVGRKSLFPFGTNLHRVLVAGPGMVLHFNFQVCIIVWAVFVASVWMLFCKYIDEDLWTLGTRKYGTPRDNCILVAWGYETQQRLMWSKILFLWIVYGVTFFLCILYSIFQLRRFQALDGNTTTMKDYAAMLVGVEGVDGSRRLEDELKEFIEGYTGQRVIGVSVGWNHKEETEQVRLALEKDLEELLEANDVETSPPARLEIHSARVRSFLYDTERKIFGLKTPEDADETFTDEQVRQMLLRLKSSPRAVVVFDTEDGRDAALEKTEDGFNIPGIGEVRMTEIYAEPDSVQWENFGHSDVDSKARRIAMGFGLIFLACMFWAVVFYSPYAYYVLTFDYSNGREPGMVVALAFSMVVVIGNAIMYEVCSRISDWVGFRFRDNREACYMILYTIACMFNVILDFVTTYITQETVLDSLGFRNYFGTHLRQIDTFTEKFETYAMQRALAENAFTYSFPSTFLIPFLIEWLPTMFLPWYLGKLIVRNHPEVKGVRAEEWLEMLPMDMGRYADILLNVILGILIFYFPGGYTWTLFLGMAGSHVYIYLFDYYKVLRQIPHCDYVSYDVEWWCQVMFAPIVGIMASCLTFKSNCQPGYPCIDGIWLIVICTLAWVLHCAVHLAIFIYIVPFFGKELQKHPDLEVPYWHCAQHIPSSWFTSNAIHCLRSKYIYKYSIPCDYYYDGKESLMRENAEIGCHFKHRAKAFRQEMSDRGTNSHRHRHKSIDEGQKKPQGP